MAAKELNVVKSLHQSGKQHVKSFPNIMVSFVRGIRQRRAYDQNPAANRWRCEHPGIIAIHSRKAGRPVGRRCFAELKRVEH